MWSIGLLEVSKEGILTIVQCIGGIIVLMGPASSIKKQKYQFLGDFSVILLYTVSVFFTFTSELRVRGNIGPVF